MENDDFLRVQDLFCQITVYLFVILVKMGKKIGKLEKNIATF